MVFGTASRIFRPHIANIWGAGTDDFLNNDVRVALFNNTPTPDANVALALARYNGAGSQWVAANEVSDGTEWPVAGPLLAGKVIDQATASLVFLDANDVSSGPSATLSDIRGVLVYNDTAADNGICFNSFGGPQAVTDGTFSVIWPTGGFARITIAA